MKITEEFIELLAPESTSIINAKKALKKDKFTKLFKSGDESFLWGEYAGKSDANYLVSVDIIKIDKPVCKCTCPSWQYPCKHILTLLYSFIEGKNFEISDVPEDIIAKRDKKQKGVKKLTVTHDINALKKKIKSQLNGLEILEKLINNLLVSGLGTIDPNTIKDLESQTKKLGSAYLPRIQIEMNRFIIMLKNKKDDEKFYSQLLDQLSLLHAVSKKVKEYLARRLEDPENFIDTQSTIEEWSGHVWQLTELKELGMFQNDVELCQLYFNSYEDQARQEHVDIAYWINLKTPEVLKTCNYRPFKADKYMLKENSFFPVAQIKELFVYPGEMNPRVRWENEESRELQSNDYSIIKSFASDFFPEVIKSVKNYIKSPLADKNPVMFLSFNKIGMVGNSYVMEDSSGNRLILEDNPAGYDPPTCQLLNLLSPECIKNQTMLVKFSHKMHDMQLCAQPLTIITDKKIIRLVY